MDILYYSFATLTTLGYGDIVPVTTQAKMFSMVETVTGVMFLAILVSRRVGLYATHSANNNG